MSQSWDEFGKLSHCRKIVIFNQVLFQGVESVPQGHRGLRIYLMYKEGTEPQRVHRVIDGFNEFFHHFQMPVPKPGHSLFERFLEKHFFQQECS